VTKSPFLALLTLAGSHAAYQSSSACSHACRERKFRRHCKNPTYPGRLNWRTLRKPRRYGVSKENRHSARFSCPSPRAYAF
jgi:hypothetical protein